jgi:aspartyl-tRNA(Asn)/glutamyl-tRNA(Gln) amidotransferase subunit A
MSFAFTSIKELKEKLVRKEVSSHELLRYFLKRFAQHDAQVQTALELFDAESIIEQTTALHDTSMHDALLAGIPGLIKDNICQKNRLTTCASKILKNYTAVYDATVCERLKQEGAFLIGRANCDEFAMGSSCEYSAHQKTKNPWDASRVPGGSSGGSVAAVAAGFVPWALGSETGGSVRLPSAFCGTTCIKPTYGHVSRYGLVAYASSLDQVSPLARDVYDTALVFSAIAGNDPKDSSSLSADKKDYTKQLTGKLPAGLRIGVVDNALGAQGMDPVVVMAIEQAIAVFETTGAQIKHLELPALDYGAATYFIVSRAEAASNLARFDGVRYATRDKKATTLRDMYCNTRHDGFGQEVATRIMVGNYVLSAGHAKDFYGNAKKVQTMIRHDFITAFRDVDVLLMPVHPAPAFPLGAFDLDKLQMDLQDYFTCPINLAGLPALSLPCGFSKNPELPLGFQLVGPDVSEELLFQVGHAYQQNTDWHMRHPRHFVD